MQSPALTIAQPPGLQQVSGVSVIKGAGDERFEAIIGSSS